MNPARTLGPALAMGKSLLLCGCILSARWPGGAVAACFTIDSFCRASSGRRLKRRVRRAVPEETKEHQTPMTLR